MKAIPLLFLVAALSACAPAPASIPGPIPEAKFVIEPIQIDQVDVLIRESFPVQVSAHITGIIGDGCASFHGVKQARQDHTIILAIEREQEQAEACTQLAQLYDETLHLDGEFPAGDYTLKVNGVERSFRID